MKRKFSLKTFNIFCLLSLFVIIVSSLYYQYNASNKITSANFENAKYNLSLETREKIRVIFDKIEYKFIKAESENLQKLNQLYALYEDHKEDLNLTSIENELNKNVNFGKYEVFLINQDYIIEKASYEKEIGFNLGQFKTVKALFNKIFSKEIDVDISSPKIDTDSRLKKYLIRLSDDGKYILQIGFSLDYRDEINKQLQYLITDSSNINLYLATEFFIQDINVKSKHFESNDEHNEYLRVMTKDILLDMNIALQDDKINKLTTQDTRDINLNKALERLIPLNEGLISFLDKNQNTIHFYSSTGSLFGESSATLLFIKTSFSLEPLHIDLRKNLNVFLLITVFVLFTLTIFELLRSREITLKITSITKTIKKNKIIEIKNSNIKDISVLIDSYNKMLSKLHTQIKINKELSYIDSLTEIRNRKSYDEKIEELISLYNRYGTIFSIAIIDVDDFKQVNDTYGHSVGDSVLKNIAKTLQTNIRKSDMLFRIGGEEFIIMFPNTGLQNSKILTENIRKKVQATLNTESQIKTTLSIGLTEINDDDSADLIFKKIDKFLYISKNNGKNQITSD